MTLSHYHQHLREIQGGQSAPSGALKRHQARVSRLAALQAEDQARRTLAEVIADLVSEWPRAGNVVLIGEWLATRDLHRRTPEQLALDWLFYNSYVDHPAPRG